MDTKRDLAKLHEDLESEDDSADEPMEDVPSTQEATPKFLGGDCVLHLLLHRRTHGVVAVELRDTGGAMGPPTRVLPAKSGGWHTIDAITNLPGVTAADLKAARDQLREDLKLVNSEPWLALGAPTTMGNQTHVFAFVPILTESWDAYDSLIGKSLSGPIRRAHYLTTEQLPEMSSTWAALQAQGDLRWLRGLPYTSAPPGRGDGTPNTREFRDAQDLADSRGLAGVGDSRAVYQELRMRSTGQQALARKVETLLPKGTFSGQPCEVSAAPSTGLRQPDQKLCDAVRDVVHYLRQVVLVAHDPDILTFQQTLSGSTRPLLSVREILDRVNSTLPTGSDLKLAYDKVLARVTTAESQVDGEPQARDLEVVNSVSGYSRFVVVEMISASAIQTFSQQFDILKVTRASSVKALFDRIGDLQTVTRLIQGIPDAFPSGLISEITPVQAAQAMISAMPSALVADMNRMIHHPEYTHLLPTAPGAYEKIRDLALELELTRANADSARRHPRVHGMLADAGGERESGNTHSQTLENRIHALEAAQPASDPEYEYGYDEELEDPLAAVVAALKGKGSGKGSGKDSKGKVGKGLKGKGKAPRVPEAEAECWHCTKTGHFARNCPEKELNLHAVSTLTWEDIKDEIAGG